MKTALRASIVGLAIVVGNPAAAEVSDKVIHAPRMWSGAVIGMVAGLVGVLFRPWLALLAIPLGLMLGPLQGIATVHDTYVGPAIIREAGVQYAFHAYGSAASVVAANLCIYWWGRRVSSRKAAV